MQNRMILRNCASLIFLQNVVINSKSFEVILLINTSITHLEFSRHQNLQMDMVRLGIGLYGVDASIEMQKKLKNVSTLTTTISQIKKIKAGETVGYGRKGKVKKDSTIAIVRIGYADGYSRA